MATLNCSDHGSHRSTTPYNDASGDGQSALIFLGTGSSGMVPNLLCMIQPADPPCPVCVQSLSVPPEKNPNYRCNTSLLIDYCQSNGKHNYIVIDVGKTFREAVLRWFTFYKIPRVDSIILTHEHADAVFGLDDIRSIQSYTPTNDIGPTSIYLSQHSMESISEKLPYLIKKKRKEGEEFRRVSQLDWKIIEEDCNKPFLASGLKFVPLPVMHGEDYICLGFLFGEKSRVAYISDVSRIPSSTEYVISESGAGQLDLLILDALYKTGSHNVHFCLPQSLETLKMLRPKQALLIGMTHQFDHHKDNEFLKDWSKSIATVAFYFLYCCSSKTASRTSHSIINQFCLHFAPFHREGIPVQFAHDGLRVPINL